MATKSKTENEISKKDAPTASSKPRKTRATKNKSVRSPEIEQELETLKKRFSELQEGNVRLSEQYGKMLETVTNLRIKTNAMLGQILKGLYLIGITPDDIVAKCNQMFRKKVVAD